MSPSKTSLAIFSTLAALALAACGGASPDVTISGTLAGLGIGLSVTVKKNTSETIALTSNGPFSFAIPIAAGNGYAVTVLSQPVGQVCTVAGGAGTVSQTGDPVPAATVSCVFNASVGATVAGLATGMTVTLSNAGVLLPVTLNGSFAIPGLLPAGSAYAVTVATQPAGQTCSVANGTGIVLANTVPLVSVTCV